MLRRGPTGAEASAAGALRRVGSRWILVLLGSFGVGSEDGFFFQPVLLFAPALLLRALQDLSHLAPDRPRRLLDVCVVLGAVSWGAGLVGMFVGGPMSAPGSAAWGGVFVAFALFCFAMMQWAASAGAVEVARSWRWPAFTAATSLVVLVPSVAVVAATRLLDGRPVLEPVYLDFSGGWIVIVVMVVGTLGPISWATSSMLATRTWFATHGEPPVGPGHARARPGGGGDRARGGAWTDATGW